MSRRSHGGLEKVRSFGCRSDSRAEYLVPPSLGPPSHTLLYPYHDASIHSIIAKHAVDPNDPTALHEQVAAELRRALAAGEARPGERLPPARDLAAVLGVNANTVYRSLRTLRDEGLLEFRRGRGITVAGTPERGAVLARAIELVSFARQQGYRPDEVISMIETISGT